ncbi:hypothetical protein LIER_10264 [Lithospermum erythrorhizon]|uniref:Uncharacterized protein n=1 Tax=Lithospermum erythrorhizon TaxID=34254 RepID=A0AAV3PJX7_LITER
MRMEEFNKRANKYIWIEEAAKRDEKGCGNVNVISGGCSGGRDSGRAKRAYAKRDIYAVTKGAGLTFPGLSFSKKDFEVLEFPNEDQLVITPMIAKFEVGRVLLDTGSSVDILFLIAYLKLGMGREQIRPVSTPLIWFTCDVVNPVGSRQPHGHHGKTSAACHKDGGVYHHGYGSQKKVRGCYLASTKRIKVQMEAESSYKTSKEAPDRNVCTLHVPKESPKKGKPHEGVRSIPFDKKEPAKVFKISTTLGDEHEQMLIRFLREYRDIFS